jgi:hypothetical protein
MRDCQTLGLDSMNFVQSSSTHRNRPNSIGGFFMSTSATNNARLPNAIGHISRNFAPSTNEADESGT